MTLRLVTDNTRRTIGTPEDEWRRLRNEVYRPYLDPRRIALATKDGRAVADPVRSLGDSWDRPYRSPYDVDRGSRWVGVAACALSALVVLYFAAELLRAVLS